MHALVLWADDASPNLGVRALGHGTAAIIRRIDPDADITFQNYGFRDPRLPFGRVRSLVKERMTGTRGMQEWLGSFDLVVDTRSGDSFTDIYGMHRLAVMSTVSEFATQAGVPVVLGPQTIGPFDTRRGRAIGRHSLRRARLVMARDTISARHATELGHAPDVVTTDVVFALPVPEVERTRDVVLNVSGLLWNENPHVDHRAYRRTLADLHARLVADGRSVTLLAHVLESSNPDNDVPAMREFAATTAPDAELVIPVQLEDVRRTVASARVVIGSRMHACLNALSVGTPAVPLAYSRKFEPLLADLGWAHTVDLRTAADPAADVMRELAVPGLADEVRGVVERAHAGLRVTEDALRAL